MVSLQEPEVQLAQRLASNEKPIRSKAIKKLRKYIHVRSQKSTGGFTGDELLKLWKGLFYCLWMQDKPLLQEELSHLISALIHSFQDTEGQFLYLVTFLQTFKREWTGIDRLRMDKFFQLVRFMFRQTFDMLQRKNWDSSVVGRFLELLAAELLQSGSAAPNGLQFHILDLYMTELAAVGSAELTADQNLTFIEPFCKTAAKTKDRTLFGAICNSIFSSIIDQAPLAIDDLMKELKAVKDSDSDSGQASEEEEEKPQIKAKMTSKPVDKKVPGKQMNGCTTPADEDEEHLEDSDTELPCDDDMTPVLQFDYAALADRLFELSSRSNTPSQNRQRLYKIIKVLRDLSEGIFPQDEYPEEVSTDEDDEMFCSRKRMKRGGPSEKEEDGGPAAKKSKGKKKLKQKKDAKNDDCEATDVIADDDNKKKKRKKKKKKNKKKAGGTPSGELNAESTDVLPPSTETVSSVKVTEAISSDGQSQTLLLLEAEKQTSVRVTNEASGQTTCETNDKNQSETCSKNKKESETSEPGKQKTPVTQEAASTAGPSAPETSSEPDATGKKKKKRKKKQCLKTASLTDGSEAESQVNPEAAPETVSCEVSDGMSTSAEIKITSLSDDASQDPSTVPLQRKKKKIKQKVKRNKVTEETPDEVFESSPAVDEPASLRKKRKTNKKDSKAEVEEEVVVQTPQTLDAEITMTTPGKRKRKTPAHAAANKLKNKPLLKAADGTEEASLLNTTEVVSSSVKPIKKKRKIPVVFEYEADEVEAAASINGHAEEEVVAKKIKKGKGVDEPSTPLTKSKPKKKGKTSTGSVSEFVSFQSNAAVPTPLFCRTKGGAGTPLTTSEMIQSPMTESKKVTFRLKNNKTAEFRKTDRSLLLSPDGSSRVPFDPKQKPKSGVLKSPPTPHPTSIKRTPKAGKKKVIKTPKSKPERRPTAADFF